MKARSFLCLFATLFLAAGCADPLEERTTNEVGDQLHRGITGQGRLGPVDRPAGDPASQHGVPQTGY